MKIVTFLFLFVLILLPHKGQTQEISELNEVVDSLYREDQIYIGFTYNIVTGDPAEISTSQFSVGFHTGFIRDFPLNEQRNVALGIGLGWSIDTYGQNLFIGDPVEGQGTRFEILDRDRIDFDTNRFTTQGIDVPLQFRWRTSTPYTYRFWRVYAGLRPSYVYYVQSKFGQQDNDFRTTEIPEFERFRLGATFTFGYNTFNFNFYYSLNSFFEDGTLVDGEQLDLRAVQIGLMFYLL